MAHHAYAHGLIGIAMLIWWMAVSHLRDGGVIILRVGWLELRVRRR